MHVSLLGNINQSTCDNRCVFDNLLLYQQFHYNCVCMCLKCTYLSVPPLPPILVAPSLSWCKVHKLLANRARFVAIYYCIVLSHSPLSQLSNSVLYT